MKPAQGFIQIVIAVIITLALGAGAIFAYQKYSQKPTVSPKQFPSSSDKTQIVNQASSSPAATDETANWKTYANQKFHFSFSYPDQLSYFYDELYLFDTPGGSGRILLQNFDGSKSMRLYSSDFQIVIEIHKLSSQVGLDDYVNTFKKSFQINETFEKSIISGENAIRGKETSEMQNGTTVWVKHNDYIFTISETSKNTIFDQILSTFKFI